MTEKSGHLPAYLTASTILLTTSTIYLTWQFFTNEHNFIQFSLRFIVTPQRKALYLQKKGCLNKAFHMLKDNEIRQYGE